jgi:hypothetical protein
MSGSWARNSEATLATVRAGPVTSRCGGAQKLGFARKSVDRMVFTAVRIEFAHPTGWW